MKLTDVFCYTLLTITMTVSCAYSGVPGQEIEEKKLNRSLNRRGSTVFVDAAPAERVFQKPKVIYRRISKRRPTKSKYGPPRGKYGSAKHTRKPGKNHINKTIPKYGSPTPIYKERKPVKYGHTSKRHQIKPFNGPTRKPIYSYYRHEKESTGFGEPPTSEHQPYPEDYATRPNFDDDISSKPNIPNDLAIRPIYRDEFTSKPFEIQLPSKPSSETYKSSYYNEPPVDSYGAPIKSNLHDLTFPSVQTPDDPSNLDQEYLSSDTWTNFKDHKRENLFGNSKKQVTKPSVVELDADVFVTPVPQETEEQQFSSYSDIFNYIQTKERKRPSYFEKVKMVNKPWKGPKMRDNKEILVGGQYAEPPARYVPKLQTHETVFADNGAFTSMSEYTDIEPMPPLGTISSYVNYKNSNMAFSPQNLNDAFSIIDK